MIWLRCTLMSFVRGDNEFHHYNKVSCRASYNRRYTDELSCFEMILAFFDAWPEIDTLSIYTNVLKHFDNININDYKVET